MLNYQRVSHDLIIPFELPSAWMVPSPPGWSRPWSWTLGPALGGWASAAASRPAGRQLVTCLGKSWGKDGKMLDKLRGNEGKCWDSVGKM